MDLGVQDEWMNKLLKVKAISNETVAEVKEVGSGAFGTVYLGKWRGQDVAIKKIKNSAFHRDAAIVERLKHEFWEESKILVRLTHTNIVQLYGVIQDGPGGTLATVMEYIKDGTLRDILRTKSGSLTRHQRLCLATDVADGMEHLHSKKIVHFDLKSANIFVDMTNPSRPVCMIGDLGLSKVNQNASISSGMRGTLPWMAPELLNGSDNHVSEMVDVYSFGIVLWEIVTGEVPYAGMDYKTIVEGVGKNSLRPLVPSTYHTSLTELMEQCWAADRLARPLFKNIARRLHSMLSQDTTAPTKGAWLVNTNSLQVIKNKDVQVVRELGLFDQGKLCEVDVAIRRMTHFSSRLSDDERRKFLQHAKILAELNHRNIAKVYGVIPVTQGGTPAVVFEYLDGPLREALSSEKWNLGHQQKLLIAVDVAVAVEYLYRKELPMFCFNIDKGEQPVFCFDVDHVIVNMTNPLRPICKLVLLDLGLDLKGTIPLSHSNRIEEAKKINVERFGDFLFEIITGKNARTEANRLDRVRPVLPRSCDPIWRKLIEDCWSGDLSFKIISRRLKFMCRAAGLFSDGSGDGTKAILANNLKWNMYDDVMSNGISSYEVVSLLSSSNRDYLIRRTGFQRIEHVRIDSLKGKKVGLYFSGLWSATSREFTQVLVKLYNDLAGHWMKHFEVVFVSIDNNARSFAFNFHEMPWLAIPYSDSDTMGKLEELFDVCEIPKLVILDENGRIVCSYGVEIVREYGIEAYPFTEERVKELVKAHEEAARRTQSLTSLLASPSRDFLLNRYGNRVSIDKLKGKMVGLYFSASWSDTSRNFTRLLVKLHDSLYWDCFDVVFVSVDNNAVDFDRNIHEMPWLAIPYSDSDTMDKLEELFHISGVPHLVIFDENGSIVTEDGVAIVTKHGIEAYPFKMERVKELKEHEENQSLTSLLVSPSRDFVLQSAGKKVPVPELEGKTVALYFSSSTSEDCCNFTPLLVEVYEELRAIGENFEVVFISFDRKKKHFNQSIRGKPWFMLPFKDKSCHSLVRYFEVSIIPVVVILGPDGKTLQSNAVEAIKEHGAEAFPFTIERVKELKEHEEAMRRNQSLTSLLVSTSRDFVLQSDGKKVPVPELEGKTVALYFSSSTSVACSNFTPLLVEVYEELRAIGENFEVVSLSLDKEKEHFNESIGGKTWFMLPFKDNSCHSLVLYFEVSIIPVVVILGPDGKTLQSNAVKAIKEHGAKAFPFTPEKFTEIAEIEKAIAEARTLESVLIFREEDFVIRNDSVKVPVFDLLGKNILLYFAQSSSQCHALLPKLTEAYHEIKEDNDDAFEVIFISTDHDQASFDELFSKMPWLALPFGDGRVGSLISEFKVHVVPKLIAMGPTGKTVSKEVIDLIRVYGSEAYPFTVERVEELEASVEEMAKEWPENVEHRIHNHELVLTRCGVYICDSCHKEGRLRSFRCPDCNFDLHPQCALQEKEATFDDKKIVIAKQYGVEGNPEREEAARRNQSLISILVSSSRYFVLQSNGKMVPVSELEEKTVALYFSSSTSQSCNHLTELLIDVYVELKAEGENFEVVLISLDDEEENFKQSIAGMPWFMLPFKDKSRDKLARYFNVATIPTVVILGPDGKTLHSNVAEAIMEHGVRAYPFTSEKFLEIAEVKKALAEAQPLNQF